MCAHLKLLRLYGASIDHMAGQAGSICSTFFYYHTINSHYFHSQCRGGSGACPDTVDATVGSACTNDVSDISGFVEEGQQCISFTRPFNPSKFVAASITSDSLLKYILTLPCLYISVLLYCFVSHS